MECVILLNGDKPKITDKDFFCGKYVICADGAYKYALSLGINVDLLVGDFDSLGYIPKGINIKVFKSEKDNTDGELAIDEAINIGAKNIIILGASGGRDDHWFANFILLNKALNAGVNATIKTDTCDILMFNKDIEIKYIKGYYISLVPFDENLHIINTEGLKYSIVDKTLSRSQTLGISNITTDSIVKIKVKSGTGILFLTKEAAKIL